MYKHMDETTDICEPIQKRMTVKEKDILVESILQRNRYKNTPEPTPEEKAAFKEWYNAAFKVFTESHGKKMLNFHGNIVDFL